MWPVSTGFLAARMGGTRVRQVRIDPTGKGIWQDVKHASYDLLGARGDNVVSRYSGRVALPPGHAGLIDEHATRVQVLAGFLVGGVPELVPVGTLVVDEVTESRTGAVEITGYSDELRVERAQLRQPVVVEAGSAILAILSLLAVVTSDVTIRSTRDAQIPRTVFERDRWAAVRQVAASADLEVFVGPDGRWVVDDAPTATADPAIILTGQVSRSVRRSRRGVPNVIVVTGDRAGLETPPPRGEATDDNPASSTWVGGPFGEVVEHVGSPVMVTDDQCRKAARTILAKRIGRSRQVTVEHVPLDAPEPGDTIGVVTPAGLERHVIDAVPHRSSGVQTLASREVLT